MSAISLFYTCALLLAASSVAQAVDCPNDACGIVGRTDPNSLALLIADLGSSAMDLCDCTCDSGRTLLHVAVPSLCGICIEQLVALECDLDVQDDFGNAPLHDAAALCLNVPTTALLRAGANPEKTNGGGDTPLCVVGTGGPPNPGECGIVARNIINVAESTELAVPGACPCRECASGEIPYDEHRNADRDGVADIIGQDGGSPEVCNGDDPPC